MKVNPLDCGVERMVINDLSITYIHGARIEGKLTPVLIKISVLQTQPISNLLVKNLLASPSTHINLKRYFLSSKKWNIIKYTQEVDNIHFMKINPPAPIFAH